VAAPCRLTIAYKFTHLAGPTGQSDDVLRQGITNIFSFILAGDSKKLGKKDCVFSGFAALCRFLADFGTFSRPSCAGFRPTAGRLAELIEIRQ